MTTAVHPLADKAARLRFNRALRDKGVPAKCCSRCLTVKALSQFSSNGGGELRAQCKACDAARQADYKARNPDKVRAKNRRYDAQRRNDPEYQELKRQAQAQRADQYRAKWTAPDGSLIEGDLSAPKRCTTIANGGCERLLTRGDFHGKRDRADGRQPLCKECTARRDAERRERERARLLNALIDLSGPLCYLCELPFSDDDPAEIEHITPESAGGPTTIDNLALAHASCNRGPDGKHDRDPWEYLPAKLAAAGIDFRAAVQALRDFGQCVDRLPHELDDRISSDAYEGV